MKVKVVWYPLFGQHNDVVEITFELDDGSTVRDLVQSLARTRGPSGISSDGMPILLTRNARAMTLEDRLNDGDVLKAFPPFEGG